jgi:hypothetical protein
MILVVNLVSHNEQLMRRALFRSFNGDRVAYGPIPR